MDAAVQRALDLLGVPDAERGRADVLNFASTLAFALGPPAKAVQHALAELAGVMDLTQLRARLAPLALIASTHGCAANEAHVMYTNATQFSRSYLCQLRGHRVVFAAPHEGAGSASVQLASVPLFKFFEFCEAVPLADCARVLGARRVELREKIDGALVKVVREGASLRLETQKATLQAGDRFHRMLVQAGLPEAVSRYRPRHTYCFELVHEALGRGCIVRPAGAALFLLAVMSHDSCSACDCTPFAHELGVAQPAVLRSVDPSRDTWLSLRDELEATHAGGGGMRLEGGVAVFVDGDERPLLHVKVKSRHWLRLHELQHAAVDRALAVPLAELCAGLQPPLESASVCERLFGALALSRLRLGLAEACAAFQTLACAAAESLSGAALHALAQTLCVPAIASEALRLLRDDRARAAVLASDVPLGEAFRAHLLARAAIDRAPPFSVASCAALAPLVRTLLRVRAVRPPVFMYPERCHRALPRLSIDATLCAVLACRQLASVDDAQLEELCADACALAEQAAVEEVRELVRWLIDALAPGVAVHAFGSQCLFGGLRAHSDADFVCAGDVELRLLLPLLATCPHVAPHSLVWVPDAAFPVVSLRTRAHGYAVDLVTQRADWGPMQANTQARGALVAHSVALQRALAGFGVWGKPLFGTTLAAHVAFLACCISLGFAPHVDRASERVGSLPVGGVTCKFWLLRQPQLVWTGARRQASTAAEVLRAVALVLADAMQGERHAVFDVGSAVGLTWVGAAQHAALGEASEAALVLLRHQLLASSDRRLVLIDADAAPTALALDASVPPAQLLLLSELHESDSLATIETKLAHWRLGAAPLLRRESWAESGRAFKQRLTARVAALAAECGAELRVLGASEAAATPAAIAAHPHHRVVFVHAPGDAGVGKSFLLDGLAAALRAHAAAEDEVHVLCNEALAASLGREHVGRHVVSALKAFEARDDGAARGGRVFVLVDNRGSESLLRATAAPGRWLVLQACGSEAQAHAMQALGLLGILQRPEHGTDPCDVFAADSLRALAQAIGPLASKIARNGFSRGLAVVAAARELGCRVLAVPFVRDAPLPADVDAAASEVRELLTQPVPKQARAAAAGLERLREIARAYGAGRAHAAACDVSAAIACVLGAVGITNDRVA